MLRLPITAFEITAPLVGTNGFCFCFGWGASSLWPRCTRPLGSCCTTMARRRSATMASLTHGMWANLMLVNFEGGLLLKRSWKILGKLTNLLITTWTNLGSVDGKEMPSFVRVSWGLNFQNWFLLSTWLILYHSGTNKLKHIYSEQNFDHGVPNKKYIEIPACIFIRGFILGLVNRGEPV